MELAGVILGAVSLAGPTYKLYKRRSQLISDVRQYEKRLKGCSDSFNIQKGLYTETWALALSLVGVEADLAIVMVDDENHPQWKDPDFLNLWNEALGEHFDAGVRVTQATLKKIEGILQRVQECQEETKQDSFIKASKAAVDEKFWKLGWGWKGKEELRTLINTLRVQNQDLKNMRDQREASRKTWVRKPREPKSYSDSDVMLAHLLAVREVSKTLHDSLTGMSACSCHDINLRLQFDINETLEAILDAKLASPILQVRSSLPTIIRIARFRLIVTKEDKNDGSTSQPIRNCSGTCIVITPVLQAGESNTGVLQLKRQMSVESQNHGLPRKRVRFADNQVVETSSPWAAVISDGAGSEEERVLHLEPELETKRLKVTSKGNSQPATSDGGAVEQSEIMVANVIYGDAALHLEAARSGNQGKTNCIFDYLHK